eukprot:5283541-Amphidinium_carterae.1
MRKALNVGAPFRAAPQQTSVEMFQLLFRGCSTLANTLRLHQGTVDYFLLPTALLSCEGWRFKPVDSATERMSLPDGFPNVDCGSAPRAQTHLANVHSLSQAAGVELRGLQVTWAHAWLVSVRGHVVVFLVVEVIKLFKNQIGDKGAKRMAQMCKIHKETLEEVHLSHNQLTARGILQIAAT